LNASSRRLTLGGLVAVTYFMVSGGPYGLEDLVGKAGYAMALAVIVLTPVLWCLPTALMVGELAAAIPSEGGYYIWVRRGMGDFWGYMEAWLTLAASAFDMAIYPTLFVAYLGFVTPEFVRGWHGAAIGVALIASCVAWNLRGAKAVGMSSTIFGVAIVVPFVALIMTALLRSHAGVTRQAATGDLLGGISIAMWNYMGWDNASTVAQEVEEPQRNYPRAMLYALVLVVVSYVLPVAVCWYTRVPLSAWSTGSWVSIGGSLGGEWLRIAIVIGGLISTAGILNSLVLSYSRLPLVLAEDGYLPRALTKVNSAGVPSVALLACGIAWAACLGFNFEHLVLVDILLYGSGLTLEFIALALLRWREPGLERPFRVPGGQAVAWSLGVAPVVLLVFAALRAEDEGLTMGAGLVALGVGLYAVKRVADKFRR